MRARLSLASNGDCEPVTLGKLEKIGLQTFTARNLLRPAWKHIYSPLKGARASKRLFWSTILESARCSGSATII